MTPAADPLVLVPGQGSRVRTPTGGHMTFKVLAADSAGSLTAVEVSSPPGDGPPLHRHPGQDELIYVLAGSLRVRLGNAIHAAGPGASVFIPRGLEHTWQVMGEEDGCFLATITPGSPAFEELFRRADALEADERRPEALGALARGGDALEVVGPTLAVTHPAS